MKTENNLYVRIEVSTELDTCDNTERQIILEFIRNLSNNPFLSGDFQERDDVNRPLEIKICGRHAIEYYVDPAAKEIKIINPHPADG